MSSSVPSVCILAGGLGSRLGALTREIPKALVEVAGEPFIHHQLRLLSRQGVEHAVLCVGYYGQMIEDELGLTFEGINLSYSHDSSSYNGTLGAIRGARDLLGPRFLVLYGDTYLRVDIEDVERQWEASGLDAMMTVFRVEHTKWAANAVLSDGHVTLYEKFSSSPKMLWIDYGLGGLTAKVLDEIASNELAHLYQLLAAERRLCGVEVTERFYEIGSPTSLQETDVFLRNLA